MSVDRFQKASELLCAALEIDSEQRPRFLKQACSGDESLLLEVESLLAAHSKAGQFIQTPPLQNAHDLFSEQEERLLVGELIGSYKIVREIGRGGMGAVYLAERSDEQYKKYVAIKLLKRGMDTDDLLKHFRRERQILATFDHPNIARLHDGGSTKTGLPYFVMEYIEGQPIDEYCDQHELNITQRLELFQNVCSAVTYAHRHLVIHRDIKHSNIIVTAEGIPKLLDFGIAKILQDEDANATATGIRLMTPEFASPEQAQGSAVTTSTDVYSLGVVLYELLTGRSPYHFTSRMSVEIARVINTTNPQLPSAMIHNSKTESGTTKSLNKLPEGSRDRLQRRLKGDLDNIVLMALRKEPERRYQSVEHFSEDIRRHLEGLPVAARKDTFAYRTAKFVRRNKIAVSAAGITFIALIAFVIGLVIQSDKITRQRDQAEKERDKSDKISEFLVNLFRSSDPYESRGNSITAREILDRGANKIANDLKNQPEVQAAVMDTIGGVYVNLGLFDRAEPLLKQALAIRKQILPANHPDLVDSLNHVGALYYGQNKPEAETTFREAITTARQLPSNKQLKLAESLSGLGKTLSVAGKKEDAKTAFQEALSIQRKFLPKDHIDIASNLIYLAQITGGTEPERMYREALAIFKKHNHPRQANCLMKLAGIEASKGNYDQAIQENKEACALRKRVFGEKSLSLAICLHNLGECYYEKGDDKSAEIIFSEVLAIREKHQDPDNPEIGFDLFFLASALHGQGKLRDAEDLYRRSLAIQKRNFPPDHPEVARSNAGLGRVLVDAGRAEEAQSYLENAQQIWRKAGSNHQLYIVESILGSCKTELGKYEEAEQLMLKSYQSLMDLGLNSARETRETRARLYHLYKVWKKPEKMNQFKD